MGEGLSNSNKQRTNCAQDGESQFTIEKVKVKKKQLMAIAALTAHILSETTRDKFTLTYADNGI